MVFDWVSFCDIAGITAPLTPAWVVAAALVSGVVGDVHDCTYTIAGKHYDFSSLRASNGSYAWTETLYNIAAAASNIITNEMPDTVSIMFELQVCGNVVSQHSTCTTPSPINMITPDGNCTSLGDMEVATWSPNPYQDGAFIEFYHGTAIDHINRHSSHLYFVCDPDHFMKPVFTEHEKTTFSWHFKIFTKLAC